MSTTFNTSSQTTFTPTSSQLFAYRRNYATNEDQKRQETEENVKEQAQDTVESVVESVKDTASEYTQRAAGAFRQAADSMTSDGRQGGRREYREPRGDRGDRGDRSDRSSRPRPGMREAAGHPEAAPNTSLYIGNLYFEVSENTLRKEFERFGSIKSVKILYDARGLSKGYVLIVYLSLGSHTNTTLRFGYIEFDEQSSADEALNSLNNQVLEGRRLAVQYAVKRADRPSRQSAAPRNPSSKTLFIGNLSYEMTDKDLNDLFREVKNVLDVRVAIDRRTGNPRGFAHADFIDVPSAEAAAEFLKTKMFYGRYLRIDYSTSNAGGGGSAQMADGARENSI